MVEDINKMLGLYEIVEQFEQALKEKDFQIAEKNNKIYKLNQLVLSEREVAQGNARRNELLQVQVQNVERTNADLQSIIDHLEQVVLFAYKAAQEKTQQNELLQQEVLNREETNADLQAEIDTLKQELGTRCPVDKDLEAQYETVSIQLANMQFSLQCSEASNKRLSQQVQDLENENEILKIAKHEKDLMGALKLNRASSTIEVLQLDNKDLKMALKDKEEDLAKLRKREDQREELESRKKAEKARLDAEKTRVAMQASARGFWH